MFGLSMWKDAEEKPAASAAGQFEARGLVPSIRLHFNLID